MGVVEFVCRRALEFVQNVHLWGLHSITRNGSTAPNGASTVGKMGLRDHGLETACRVRFEELVRCVSRHKMYLENLVPGLPYIATGCRYCIEFDERNQPLLEWGGV